MRTFFLEQQDIIKITGQRFYKRGYDYFKKGRVHGLSFNPAIHSWSAHVRGAQNYQVRIFFFEDDELEAKCNCPAYDTHYTCKHIAAVLLAISKHDRQQTDQTKKEIEQPTVQSKQITSDPFPMRMMEAFESVNMSHRSERIPLQVDYTLTLIKNGANSQTFLTTTLRVGEKQPYIIKDIRNFLLAVRKEQAYPITNKFNYDPRKHVFTEADKTILAALLEAHQHEAMYASDYYEFDRRGVTISPYLSDSFLHAIKETQHSLVKENGEVLTNISLTDNLPKLSFPVELENNSAFLIDFSDLFLYQYLAGYAYLLKGNSFYKLSTDQLAIIEQIYQLLPYRNKQSHRISKEMMGTFASHVIPFLEKIGEISYTTDAQATITTIPLQTIIYIDEIKQALVAEVVFQYGNDQFKPYQKKSKTSSVIKRDTNKENDIISQLDQAGFLYLNQRFQLFNHEKIYQFIYQHLETLQKHATIYLSKQVGALRTEQEPVLQTNIGLSSNGMLDISFDMEGISDHEVQEVLQALIEKKQYYRIANGPLLKLENESFLSFKQFAETLQLQKKDLTDQQIQISAARSFQIEDSFSTEVARYEAAFDNLLTVLKEPEDVNYQLPATLTATLRDYQQTGFQWLKTLGNYQLGGILADEMGLGKTVQTISYLLSEQETKQTGVFQALVIAPASLVYNWKKEFEKFSPTLTTEVIIGTKEQRESVINTAPNTNVFITSYPLIRKDASLYINYEFDALILDEAQFIKNHLTLTAKATRLLKAKQRFALSGTPIENGLDELWSIFQTISPGFLGSKKQFLSFDSEYIKKITKPFILRRLKEDVLAELPAKIETEQYAQLTKQQKEVYLAYLDKMQTKLTETFDEKGFNKGKLEILAGLTRLRQICCHPSLFLENYQGKSGKLEHLQTLVADLRANNSRILIFSQFSSMLKVINETLTQEGYKIFYLDGSTPSHERLQMADAFNAGEKEVFLISLKAGGTGLNLTGADTVILYDLWWNPAVEAQAAGRAHRIGQKKVVQVIRLITEGTIEEKIFQLQAKKRALVDQVIQPGETMLSSLTQDELRELLTINR